MSENPLENLVADLGTCLSGRKHSDVILGKDDAGQTYPLIPSEFSEIRPAETSRKMAFVDGGNGLLAESANHLIMVNRVYFSLFQGSRRVAPVCGPRIQFFSYVVLDTPDTGITYSTRLFPYTDNDRRFLPDESALSSKIEGNSVLDSSRFSSLSRRFAEWQMAIRVVESELEAGDMLVMDGSLQTSFENEAQYADRLYRAAQDKGVIVCGLAKTSRLVTKSGHPLLARVAEIARDVPYGSWYVKVADRISPDGKEFMLAVKFHNESRFVFRFEILRDQFHSMTPDDLDSVLGSLAENSRDVSMIGYPYGALDADRFAQIRTNELSMYRRHAKIEMLKRPEWKMMQMYDTSLMAHDVLNGATV